MLCLSRKIGEEIVIDERIKIKVLAPKRAGLMHLGIEAPKHVKIRRAELPPREVDHGDG